MTALTDTWKTRLPAKYRDDPETLGLIELLAAPMQETKDVLDYILSNDSIDTAEGVFLDYRGELIGVARPPAQEENVFRLCSFADTAEDIDNRHGLAPADETSGGYLTGFTGVLSKLDPGSYMGDPEYRLLIKAKAAAFRQKATRAVLYNYLVAFGIRAGITESVRYAELAPENYETLNYWVRNYIETKGFRPAGIQIKFAEQTTPDSEV